MKEGIKDTILVVVIIVAVVVYLCLMPFFVHGVSPYSWTTKEYTVYTTDAPFGKYWIHTYGEMNGFLIVFHGYTDSRITESYTIKFMEGNELHTIILPSTDSRLHIYLTDDNTTMRLYISYYSWDDSSDILRNINDEEQTTRYSIALYIPRPEICQISGTVME